MADIKQDVKKKKYKKKTILSLILYLIIMEKHLKILLKEHLEIIV